MQFHAARLLLAASGQGLGHGIDGGDAAGRVGGDDGVADRGQRHFDALLFRPQLLLAAPQRVHQRRHLLGHVVEGAGQGARFQRAAHAHAHRVVAVLETVGGRFQAPQHALVEAHEHGQQGVDDGDVDGRDYGLLAHRVPHGVQLRGGRELQRQRGARADGALHGQRRHRAQAGEPGGEADRLRRRAQRFQVAARVVEADIGHVGIEQQGAGQHRVERAAVARGQRRLQGRGQVAFQLARLLPVARPGRLRFAVDQQGVAHAGDDRDDDEDRQEQAGIGSHPHPA